MARLRELNALLDMDKSDKVLLDEDTLEDMEEAQDRRDDGLER